MEGMCRYLMLAAAALAASQSVAGATMIGFEASEGYVLGSGISGKPAAPATQWTGDSVNRYVVSSGNGGQVATFTGGAISTAVYHPTATDLGLPNSISIDKPVISYRFDVSMAALGASKFRPRFGGTSVGSVISDFELSSVNGYFYYSTAAGTSIVAKTATGSNFVATAGTFYTISGVFDFSQSKFTLFVDGVEQKDSGGNGSFTFRNTNLTDLYFWLTMAGTADSTNFSIDNIALQAVPETASFGILGLGATLLLKRRR